MEQLQRLLNFTNENGEVITLFDGKVTLSQLVVCIIGLLVVGFALKVLKGIFRTIMEIVAICVVLIHYGIASPTQLADIAGQIKDKGIESYQSFASMSDNIKIEDSDVQIKLNDNWVSVSDITSFIQGDNGVVTVVVDDETITIEDEAVLSLLNTFK